MNYLNFTDLMYFSGWKAMVVSLKQIEVFSVYFFSLLILTWRYFSHWFLDRVKRRKGVGRKRDIHVKETHWLVALWTWSNCGVRWPITQIHALDPKLKPQFFNVRVSSPTIEPHQPTVRYSFKFKFYIEFGITWFMFVK